MHRFNFEKRIWRDLQAQGEELQQPRIEFEEFVLGVLFQCKRQMSVDRVRECGGPANLQGRKKVSTFKRDFVRVTHRSLQCERE